MRPPRPRAWPIPIGVLAIMSSVIGLIGALWGLLGSWVSRMCLGARGMPPREPYLQGLRIASLFLAVVLMTSAIGLLLQRPWSRRGLLAWALAKMFVGLCFVANDLIGVSQWSDLSGRTWEIVGYLVWISAFPAFLLIWFMRSRVRSEVSTWRKGMPA
jgi:hypothetical protein